MSFGSGTGFGGFGQNNQSSGFGGFGANTNAGGGFGSNANTQTTSLFGSTPNKPFGTTTTTSSGGLFGSTTATTGTGTGFGGFGSNTSSTGFGANAGSNTLFGSQKTGFGTGNNASGGLFGSGGGFGTTGTTGTTTSGTGFGSGTALSTSGVPPCEGTGSTPFSPFTDKDGTPGSQTTNHYQSISCMPPYQKYSFEELRLADYTHGRRFGNSNGQSGAFGQSTGFGGFGSNTGTGFSGGSGFGANTTSTSTFGGNNTTSGFGSGGLFSNNTNTSTNNAQKPSLFGNTPATTTPQTGGGMFGTSGSAGFGTGGTGFGGGTSGGLFGQNNQNNTNTANKGFSFGGNTPSTGFGTNNNTSGGLFGATNTSTPFGGTPQNNANTNTFGSFGQNQNQQNQQNQNQGSSLFGGGGFGANNQPSSGGLFGTKPATSTPSGGLFGGTNNQGNTGSSLFGNNNNQQNQTSSLFGNNQQKPGGLFGGTPTNANATTGGGLFGSGFGNNNNNPNQQNQGSSLFGNNQQKPGGLFGGAASAGTGSSLFGNNNTNTNNQASLFGASTTHNQNQSSGLFGGNSGTSNLFGNSQQNQQSTPQQQSSFSSSIIDPNAYGTQSIFGVLQSPPEIPEPIATPLAAANRPKKAAFVPSYKLNPSQSSRLLTPVKRGYGFNYSTYGTPGSSGSSTSTPGGLHGSLLGTNLAKNLNKSMSMSSLRRSFTAESDSVLTPGAFSSSNVRYGSGLKRLTIDRNLRHDLFNPMGTPNNGTADKEETPKTSSKLKKKVSFDSTPSDMSKALTRTESPSASPSAEDSGLLRSSTRANGIATNGSAKLDQRQVQGNELAVVHEDESLQPSPSSKAQDPLSKSSHDDKTPGIYWSKPSKAELANMSREQLKHVTNFTIGREGCGHVTFDQPVDLTKVALDQIYGTLCQITVRRLTVYPDDVAKPPVGEGLNVPSTITLENSWPRANAGKSHSFETGGMRFNKHVDRLQKVGGTTFVGYNKDTGEWVFKVPHFTTYGLDYDDDDEEEIGVDASLNQSTLSAPPDTPTPAQRTTKSPFQNPARLAAFSNAPASVNLDTSRRMVRNSVPGAFDEEAASEDEEMDDESTVHEDQSFLDERSVELMDHSDEQQSETQDSTSNLTRESGMSNGEDEFSMAGSFPEPGHTTELPGNNRCLDERTPVKPKSILKPSQQQTLINLGTPGEKLITGGWAEQLQRTISPRKQDRQALRQSQGNFLKELADNEGLSPRKETRPRKTETSFSTSIDLMHSLFGQQQEKSMTKATSTAIEWPYAQKPKTFDAENHQMSDVDKSFHQSFKPNWSSKGLLYGMPSRVAPDNRGKHFRPDIGIRRSSTAIPDRKDVYRQKLVSDEFDMHSGSIEFQRSRTEIVIVGDVPQAQYQITDFEQFSQKVPLKSREALEEKSAWDLAHILFDDYEDDISKEVPVELHAQFSHRIQKDRLSQFWEKLVAPSTEKALEAAKSPEEKAIVYLSVHDVQNACSALLQGKDYRLATLIAQIGGDQVMRDDIRQQIKEWRELKVISEMTDAIRALYELLTGNACRCEGTASGTPLEDRASTFVMSERFHMDWKRSFGLRLWYSILEDDPIEVAIQKYQQDLADNIELKKPTPWFIEEKIADAWKDPYPETRESVLWSLLQAFTSTQPSVSSLSNLFMPENTSPTPLSSRLGFQFLHAVGCGLIKSFSSSDISLADQIAINYAAERESAGQLHWAVFVLLHISDANSRRKAVQDILTRYADSFGGTDETPFTIFMNTLRIPEAWIWEAKALHARAVLRDHVQEVKFLLKAQNWNTAHETLCRDVAPKAIIERDYLTLKALLSGFGGQTTVPNWEVGGQIFVDYLAVMDKKGKESAEVGQALRRLVDTLPVVSRKGQFGFEEMVAISEMGGVVGRRVVERRSKGVSHKFVSCGDDESERLTLLKIIEGPKVLRLPLTEDACLNHTLDLSLGFYRAVMAAQG
ncbi:MAG: hypothetical protein M1834_002876 [Cirrosporium novae-zelandiae]|nr:MAG: hypothetical protein M1834_002876 [Cirrosporium novae-zelandiae]